MRRQCGGCTLCCRLLPVPPLQKKGGERCKHQRHGKGCAVWRTVRMPRECGFWNCRWLVNDDADDLSRPDRVHYVLDIMPDYVTISDDVTGERRNVQVAQIWCDPKYLDAHRDPALRRWMERRAADGIASIVRYSERDAIVVFAPSLSSDGQWHEVATGMVEKAHTLDDIEAALGEVAVEVTT